MVVGVIHNLRNVKYTVNPLLFERRWDCRIRGVFKLQRLKVNERSIQDKKEMMFKDRNYLKKMRQPVHFFNANIIFNKSNFK